MMHGSCRRINPERNFLCNQQVTSASTSSLLKPLTVRPEIQTVGEKFIGVCNGYLDDHVENDEESPKEVLQYHRSFLASSTKREIRIMRGKLLSTLPIYKEKHLQSSNASLVGKRHDRVVLDLLEQGFTQSADFLKKLLDFESQYRSTPDNVADSNNWPWLYLTESLLNVVVSSLREAELARRHGRRLLEVAAWFRISVYTALRKDCWYWLADLLFKQCLKVTKILRTGVKREASIRFTYAQFLSEKLNCRIEALRQFNIVRKLTRTYHLKGIDLLGFNGIDSDLHSQSCFFLNKVCLTIAREIREKNPSMAVKLSQKAQGFIDLACSGQATGSFGCTGCDDAVFELALSLIAAKNYTTAITKLNSYQAKCKDSADAKGYCRALYLRAQCYQHMNKKRLAVRDLKVLCKIAVKCNIQDMSTLAELEYAELLLTLGSKYPVETLKNVAYAFLTSHDHVDRDIRLRARCLVGIGEGLYLWPYFQDMVVACQTSREEFNKLVEWKSCRAPFIENQIQAFTIQLPKRGGQINSAFMQQIQKFVLPEKVLEILGERLESNHIYRSSAIDD